MAAPSFLLVTRANLCAKTLNEVYKINQNLTKSHLLRYSPYFFAREVNIFEGMVKMGDSRGALHVQGGGEGG
jgi:hypothetical protein